MKQRKHVYLFCPDPALMGQISTVLAVRLPVRVQAVSHWAEAVAELRDLAASPAPSVAAVVVIGKVPPAIAQAAGQTIPGVVNSGLCCDRTKLFSDVRQALVQRRGPKTAKPDPRRLAACAA